MSANTLYDMRANSLGDMPVIRRNVREKWL